MLSTFQEKKLDSIDELLSTSDVIYGELYKSKSSTVVPPGNISSEICDYGNIYS